MYAKLSRFVRARSDHPSALSAFGIRADDHRLSFIFGLVELFDGCVERIHIDVKDEPHNPPAWGYRPLPLQGGRRRRCTKCGWPVGPTLIRCGTSSDVGWRGLGGQV